MEDLSNNQKSIDVEVQDLKREVDALQIKVLSGTKPWYKKASTLIALFALIFSFGTTIISYQRNDRSGSEKFKTGATWLDLAACTVATKGD